MTATIIIPALDKRDMTAYAVEAVRRHTKVGTYDLVVFDNGSREDLSDVGADVVFRSTHNLGFGAGCNAAVGFLPDNADPLIFLNNDTEVAPGWLPELRKALRMPKVGVAGAYLHYLGGAPQHSGIDFHLTPPLVAYNIMDERASGYVPAVTGACMAVSRKCWDALLGFDETFYNGNEDTDFCLRAHQKGFKSYYTHEAQVMHLESQSGPERWARLGPNIENFQRRWNYIVEPTDRTTAILIPAMRADKVKPMVQRIRETVRDCRIPYSIHFMTQRGTPCRDALTDVQLDCIEQHLTDVYVHQDNGGSWGQRLNYMYRRTTEPYVFCGADDVLFWDDWLRRAHETMGTMPGVVSVNDQVHPGVGTLPLISRLYIQHYSGCMDQPDVIIHPGYHHNYSETELYCTAQRRQRWRWSADAVVEHRHPLVGKAEHDAVYELGQRHLGDDEHTFNERADRLWRPFTK